MSKSWRVWAGGIVAIKERSGDATAEFVIRVARAAPFCARLDEGLAKHVLREIPLDFVPQPLLRCQLNPPERKLDKSR